MSDFIKPHSTINIPSKSSPANHHLVFSFDPETNLFETHKSEDTSVIHNRVTLLEIHEVLMQMNLNLLPSVKLLTIASTIFRLCLAFSLCLTILMLLLQDLALLKIVAICFGVLSGLALVFPVIQKIVYLRHIRKVLRNNQEAYHVKGLKWYIKSSCRSFFSLSYCKLILETLEASHETYSGTKFDTTKDSLSSSNVNANNTNYRLTGADGAKKEDHTLTYCSNRHKDVSFNDATQAENQLDYSIADISPDNTQRDFIANC